MIEPGSIVTLDVEKAVAGGRMLARHDGRIVLVWGAIPGERVAARVERASKGVVFAEAVDVLSASPDRRPAHGDWRCGGSVLAHVSYARQLELKREIVRDAFSRIARLPIGERPGVVASPEAGYRMRARLHAYDGRLGFYREGTHDLCDAAATGQLLPATSIWLAAAEEAIARHRLTGLAAIELAENVGGDERAGHLELHAGADPARFAPLAEGLVGLSAQRADRREVVSIAGSTIVSDRLEVGDGVAPAALHLRRDVRAFFQGNRFLLERLVRHVAGLVRPGPVIDLYAGVGLFGLALAVTHADTVTAVEGDPIAGRDLERNAEPFGGRVHVERRSVEAWLRGARSRQDATVIVDPPRTGMTKDALAGVLRLKPARIVYVSCDVATLARDARALVDAGYELAELDAMDLFPNTAHVETIAAFGIRDS